MPLKKEDMSIMVKDDNLKKPNGEENVIADKQEIKVEG
jgi:hypothetical protein